MKIFLIALFLITSPLYAKLFNHTSFSLPNGLRVYMIKNTLAPVVNVSLYYKVGTADDPRDECGLSHFLEHMMFKGTKAVPNGEFDRLILERGGVYNARTSFDYTCYSTLIAKDQLELILFLEADRMQNLAFSKEDVESERQVVHEERAMRMDNHPFGKGLETYLHSLFWKHPYGIPPIGYPEHIDAYTHESAMEHYKKYYAPNNAVLLMTGDLDAEEVKKLCEKYFGKIPQKNISKRNRIQEPSHNGTVLYIDHKAPRIRLAAIHASYLVPQYQSQDHKEHVFPLMILAQLMGGNELSRLYRHLVEEDHIAAGVNVNYEFASWDMNAMTFSLTLNNHMDPDQGADILLCTIKSLREKGISPDELAQAKHDLIAQLAFIKDGVSEADDMFSGLIFNIPPEDLETWDEKINAVTGDQILKAAQLFLKEPAVVLTLYPEDYERPILTLPEKRVERNKSGATQAHSSQKSSELLKNFFIQLWEEVRDIVLSFLRKEENANGSLTPKEQSA